VLSQLKRGKEAFSDVAAALSKSRGESYCVELAPSLVEYASAPEEAMRVLTLVIEADPNSTYARTQRGWRYQEAGKLDLAFTDYLAAARQGDAWAQLQVGKSYWHGTGIAANRTEALAWMRKSAAQGNADAKLSLEQALKLLKDG
jgi:TPR repeat protein